MASSPSPALDQAIAARLVAFCRALRDRDLSVTPGRALDAARSLAALGIDVADRSAFHAALRANLTTTVDDYPVFDAVFAAFWGEPAGESIPDLTPTVSGPPRPPEAVLAEIPITLDAAEFADDGQGRLAGGFRSAAEDDLLTHKDFAALSGDEVTRARRLVRQLVPALATVPSRRRRPATSGGEIDVRRTIRAAGRTGGEVVRLSRTRRRLRRLRLVALCDVSGSMDLYSSWLLQFLYALQGSGAGVRTFVFSTRLHDVSAVLRRKRYEDALDGIGGVVATWGGGTAIARCLGEFNSRHGASLVGPRTIVLVASDGWERGDPEQLAREVALLRRRAYRVIWLNPLKGHDGYEPLAAGMAAALPHVDHFLAANSLASLARLRTTLASLG